MISPLIFKSVVIPLGVLGTVSALSVPLSISRRESNMTNHVNVVNCQNLEQSNNMEVILFGDKNSFNVCWSREKGHEKGNIQQSTETIQKLNSLFAKKWDKSIKNWRNDNYDSWMQQCTDSESGWVILTSEGVAEYLGLCNSTTSTNIPFIKKEGKTGDNSNSVSLSVCSADCWSEEELSNNTKVFKKEKEDSWVRLSFYRN